MSRKGSPSDLDADLIHLKGEGKTIRLRQKRLRLQHRSKKSSNVSVVTPEPPLSVQESCVPEQSCVVGPVLCLVTWAHSSGNVASLHTQDMGRLGLSVNSTCAETPSSACPWPPHLGSLLFDFEQVPSSYQLQFPYL